MSSEMPRPVDPYASIREQIHDQNPLDRLIENGDEGAILLTGVSQQALIRMLNEGVLPSSSAQAAPGYADSSFARINHCYPIIDNLKPEMGEFATIDHDHEQHRLDHSALQYAYASGVTDTFEELSGFRASLTQIVSILDHLDSQKCDEVLAKVDRLFNFGFQPEAPKPEILEKYRGNEQLLIKHIEQALNVAGVLIFINPEVLKLGSVQEGYEGDDEVVVLSLSGIPLEAISGIYLDGS